jgi:hypothetical protein
VCRRHRTPLPANWRSQPSMPSRHRLARTAVQTPVLVLLQRVYVHSVKRVRTGVRGVSEVILRRMTSGYRSAERLRVHSSASVCRNASGNAIRSDSERNSLGTLQHPDFLPPYPVLDRFSQTAFQFPHLRRRPAELRILRWRR